MIKNCWKYPRLNTSLASIKLKYAKIAVIMTILLSSPLVAQAYPTMILTQGYLESTAIAGWIYSSDYIVEDTVIVPLNGEFGSYHAQSRVSLPANGQPKLATAETAAFATIDTEGVSLTVDAKGYRNTHAPGSEATFIGGIATATMMFTLTESTTIDFQWLGDNYAGTTEAKAQLKNASGETILTCIGGSDTFSNSATDNCVEGEISTEPKQNLEKIGHLVLDNGEYEVTLFASPATLLGTTEGGSGTLTLAGVQVVPIPASIWLFGAGLMGLFACNKKTDE